MAKKNFYALLFVVDIVLLILHLWPSIEDGPLIEDRVQNEPPVSKEHAISSNDVIINDGSGNRLSGLITGTAGTPLAQVLSLPNCISGANSVTCYAVGGGGN